MLIILCVLLVFVGIGIVVGLVCAACAAALVMLGVISSATLLAVMRRRVSTGVRALHYQLAMLFGLPSGAAAGWVGAGALHFAVRQRDVLLLGALGGATAGALLALSADYAARMIYRRVTGR